MQFTLAVEINVDMLSPFLYPYVDTITLKNIFESEVMQEMPAIPSPILLQCFCFSLYCTKSWHTFLTSNRFLPTTSLDFPLDFGSLSAGTLSSWISSTSMSAFILITDLKVRREKDAVVGEESAALLLGCNTTETSPDRLCATLLFSQSRCIKPSPLGNDFRASSVQFVFSIRFAID